MATPSIDDYLPLPASGPDIDDYLPRPSLSRALQQSDNPVPIFQGLAAPGQILPNQLPSPAKADPSLGPISESELLAARVHSGQATPVEKMRYEEETSLPISKKLLRAGLGTGEEGKGVLRVALGNALDVVGRLSTIYPSPMREMRQATYPGEPTISDLGLATAELGRENIAEARQLGKDLGGGKAGDVIQDLGAMLTVSAPAIPAAMLGGLPAAAVTAGAIQAGANLDQYEQQLIRRGYSPKDARRQAMFPAALSGAITAALTRYIPGGAEMLINKVGSGEVTKRGAGRFIGQLIKKEIPLEVLEEDADTLGQSAVELLMVNPDKTASEIGQELAMSTAGAVLMTGLVGGGAVVIGRTAEGISRPIEERIEESGFQRRSRRVADVQARAGFTPEGRTTATERTYEAPVPISRPAAQVEPAPQPAIDPSTFIVSVQAPQGEVPGNIQIVDPAQTERSQSPTVESLLAAGVQVPDFTQLPQGQYAYPEAVKLLQGDRRSSQLERPLTEGPAPIPAAPPASAAPAPSLWTQIDTSTTPGALTPFQVHQVVDEFKKAYPNVPKIEVVNYAGQLPIQLPARPSGQPLRPGGAIVRSKDGNTIYIVAERMTSNEHLKSILAHEAIGHHGVESVIGVSFQDLAMGVERKFKGMESWTSIVESYGDDQYTIGKELIARMAEGDIQDLSLWEQIVAFIRKWWRDHVSRTNPISDAEIRKALVDARKFLQGTGQAVQANTGTSFAEEPATSEENPFDRMRRESGAEPPPELTPEQQAARDRNEKQRGMRPNPLTSFALEPADQAAYENGDDVWVTTKVAGTDDNIRDRTRVTVESTVTAQQHAKSIFDEAGVQVEWLEAVAPNPDTGQPGKGIWKYVKAPNEEGGRKLAQLLERELKKENTDENVLLMGSLINSIRYNDKLGNADGVFDLPTRRALYAMSQAAASIRGVMLQELNQHPASIDDVARNVDLVLNRIWHDAFGGEVIDGVMAEIRKGTQAFITRPLIQHVLAQNPTLQGALDLVTVLNEDLKGLPDALALLEEVFKTPFYNLADFGKALEKRLIEQYKVDPKEAAKIAKEFQAAFNPSLKQGANEALKIAVSNLSYDAKAKVKGKKSIEALVMEAIKQGALESGEVLRKIAKDNHWNPPTDEQIDHMKRLSDRLNELKNLKPADLAERKKMGATDQDIENARRDKVAKLGSEIARVRRDMETAWAKMTKPVSLIYGLPFIGQPEIRANTARAINEFIAANLLAKFGFGTRQFVAIFSQFVAYVPSRAIGDAMVNNAHATNWKEKQPFIKEVAGQLRDGYKQQFGAIRPALAAAQAAFLGRGGGQQIGQLMSGLNALDRLTKQAEERWAAGDYSRALLLYFFSSVKLGYRIAQGLDRLQGIPAHYQNMRAQVARGLMDAGKTRLEADNSADLVIGDMNAQWMLATVAVRDAMLAEGIEVTPQKVRQNSWNLVKRWQYQRIKEAGLKADAFEEESNFLENTIGWNKKEIKGLGGAVARALRQVEQVAESKGLPLVMTRFSNAIGITINRFLAYTPLWQQANVGGYGESAWFKSEVDRAQRRVEGYVGTAMGAIALMLAYSGMLVVRLKWPKDKEERDLFERQGHRPNTVEIPTGDNEFIPISLNNSPFMLVAPYLAAGAALRDKVDDLAKKQASLDAHAAELGVTAERLPGLSIGDYGLVAVAAAQQAILGGRTVSGLIGSVSTYGVPNAKKTAASYASALTPWLPGVQEVTRMAGVTLDERLATVGDFLLPLPTSGARKLNLLGDPVRTPDDLQRITQVLTGGSYPGIVDGNRAKEVASYKALFESGYRPPSINPMQGYLIDGSIRPMKGTELQRYTEARGRNLKEALAGLATTGDQDQDKKAARDLYKSANDSALSEVGAASVPRGTSGSVSTVKAPNAPRASRLRIRSARRLRSPRLRGGRIRRIRTRSSRRVRRIRSVRLAD